eukprot:CAMPEP_0198147242 /NCGR_PEP_ID=MMETSP1443-20131203/34101_1 /TAXON_ID=186043 /ORGANISM="Entomoneis sp., Strain CCMP2396" /LENGTH=382 /DNA_ID=CAMNT_0043811475 /DNA_START=220 /DNA_END=1369 /DNA_ORIENTATION=-
MEDFPVNGGGSNSFLIRACCFIRTASSVNKFPSSKNNSDNNKSLKIGTAQDRQYDNNGFLLHMEDSSQEIFSPAVHQGTQVSLLVEHKKDEASSSIDEINHQVRFGGINRLYSAHAGENAEDSDLLNRLQESTVVIVGLGGVGSWAAEALCRSGIGHLVLIDLDDICISNINRQLHALSSTVGKFKIHVLADRCRDINPACHVTCIDDFISTDNANEILNQVQNITMEKFGKDRGITAVLDSIDGSKEKSALLAACADSKLPTVTCGGAAGRSDPSAIVCVDMTRVENDKLLSSCRKYLRKFHNFPPGFAFHEKKTPKSWNLPAVYSEELVPDVPTSSSSNLRQCDGALGTACFVTGTFGFLAAAQIVKGIAQKTLKPPRRR